jgi:GTP-binding protein
MFVDRAVIHIKAGKGGDGRVSFRREKYIPEGGPDGGDGGRGGSIIAVVDEGMRTLMDFRYQRSYKAQPGDPGGAVLRSGKSGEDMIIRVPAGTLIRDKETGKIIADLIEKGDKRVIAKGGKGGRGNTHFKSSVKRTPTYAEQGTYGDEREVILELKMLADVGLLGFPNVGKSTLLSMTTKAKPKIANYHFTTITPNLGVVEAIKGESFVLADIPGLIEGASEGVGLGHDFLRHVERTRVLIHVVDVSGMEGRNPIEDFDIINAELSKYSTQLEGRIQVVAANKTDLLYDRELVDAFVKEIEGRGYKVFEISAATGSGIEPLMQYVTEVLDTVELPALYTEDDLFTEVEDINANEVNYYMDEEVYVVDGVSIERLVYSTDFEDIDSLRRFQEILRKKGVIEGLREMGVQDGDTVRIFDFEFEFYN